jgi:hypothetical protein
MNWLKNRIVYHCITTIVFAIGGALVEGGIALSESADPRWHLLAIALPLVGGAMKDPIFLQKLFGIASPAVLILVVGALFFASPARAQTSATPFLGGCFEKPVGPLGQLCVQPDLSYAGLAFKGAGPKVIAAPSVGYALMAWHDKWYMTGLTGHLGLEAGDGTAGTIDLGVRIARILGIKAMVEWAGAHREFFPVLDLTIPLPQ